MIGGVRRQRGTGLGQSVTFVNDGTGPLLELLEDFNGQRRRTRAATDDGGKVELVYKGMVDKGGKDSGHGYESTDPVLLGDLEYLSERGLARPGIRHADETRGAHAARQQAVRESKTVVPGQESQNGVNPFFQLLRFLTRCLSDTHILIAHHKV